MDKLFEEYALSHILLSYEKYPEIFDIYKIQVENSLNVEVASYTSDQLAYFYTEYATKYDVVDFNGDDPRLYFIKRIKDTSPKTDYWVFDEHGLEMPVLKGEFAVDLYRYLFNGEEEYQTGLFFLIFAFINTVMSGIREKRTITDLLSHTRVCDLRFDSRVKASDLKNEGEGELEKLRHQYNSSDGSLYFDSTCFNNTERK